MSGEPAEFDLNAAWARKAQGDLRAFMEGFAGRMADALPGRVRVEHRGSVLLGGRRVAKVSVAFETERYTLALDHGELRAERATVVRGVAIRGQRRRHGTPRQGPRRVRHRIAPARRPG